MVRIKKSYFLEREKGKLLGLLKDYTINPQVIEAFAKTDRHLFVREEFLTEAYQDHPLPIGQGQVISQPSLVAQMTQALKLSGKERVLEIGTGSGFQAAILARLARQVFTMERFAKLAEQAKKNLKKAKIKNVKVVIGDGSKGYPKEAPFGAILLSAASQQIPEPLAEQLAEGGRLVMPLGGRFEQEVILYRKEKGRLAQKERLTGARFVPLVGEHGWTDDSH